MDHEHSLRWIGTALSPCVRIHALLAERVRFGMGQVRYHLLIRLDARFAAVRHGDDLRSWDVVTLHHLLCELVEAINARLPAAPVPVAKF